MTAAELLQPRFEVIADYPDSRFKVGQIIETSTKLITEKDVGLFLRGLKYNFEKHPHLFRKLHWWEKRTEDQMPNRVKYKELIFEVVNWNMKKLTAKIQGENSRHVIFLEDLKQELFFPID
jgi:hypothetical protein